MVCSPATIYAFRTITFTSKPAITNTKLNALGSRNVSGLKKFDVER